MVLRIIDETSLAFYSIIGASCARKYQNQGHRLRPKEEKKRTDLELTLHLSSGGSASHTLSSSLSLFVPSRHFLLFFFPPFASTSPSFACFLICFLFPAPILPRVFLCDFTPPPPLPYRLSDRLLREDGGRPPPLRDPTCCSPSSSWSNLRP